ncbi:phosphorylcholine transferase LicD [uncultured Methanobrevibacter sp.]|uniref:LicD family protein n=1 Tax=uncultured Methanobrevibacter sp. TaxID=253161 RepID=UPI0025DD627C|nr:LicD family protein [uncultured Methanobrevibacter sp.]
MVKCKKYNDATLKHLQKVQLMILKDFIKICEENKINYFVYGGTLLGTIRHEGFIPWDDDIDVIMFRKDFEKFNKIMTNKPNKKYNFFNVLNEETYHYTFARLFLKNTLYEEDWNNQVNYTQNIYIDIFILDNVPNNSIKRFIHKWSSFILNQLTMYSLIKFDNTSKLKKIVQNAIYYILKILPISPNSIKLKCVKTFSKYVNEECDQVCDFPAICQMPIYNKKDWLPLKKAKFENINVNVPNNPDSILTRIYGNYMELPPKEKRFRYAPEKIDFGKY